MTPTLDGIVDTDVMAAAVIAAGEEAPGASEAARRLAEGALAAADQPVMEDIADHLDAEHVSSGKAGPRVSDLGNCRRAVWYREQPPEGYEPLPAQYRRQAALGSVLHAASQAARQVRYPWRRYELELSIPGLDRPGKVDEYDPVLGEVTDLKSAGRWRWDNFADGPSDRDWGQAGIYGLALDRLGLPVRTLRIVAVNRENGDEEPFRRPFDPAQAQQHLDRLVELATMLDLGVVPPRDGDGPSSFPCASCPARAHCWQIDAAEAAGRSPESFTVLGAEPEDPTIAWAADRVVAARASLREAEKAEKAAKALLDGIPPGEYGDFIIALARREMPDYKGSFERLVQLYALSEAHRPPVDEVAAPLRRTDRYTSVKRKRVAARKRKGGESS